MSNSIGWLKEQNIPAQHLIGIKVRLLQRLTASHQPFISAAINILLAAYTGYNGQAFVASLIDGLYRKKIIIFWIG